MIIGYKKMKTQIKKQIARVLGLFGYSPYWVSLTEYNRLNKLGVGVIW